MATMSPGNTPVTPDLASLIAAESTRATAAEALAALKSRQIIAGTGLTGGGDLTADRTLAVGDLSATYALVAEPLAAKKASNLSDLASASTARTNLGLAAVAASGSATDITTGTLAAARVGDLSATYALLVAAPTGVAATDTANIQAAINAGGVARLQAGTYVCNLLQIKSNSVLVGHGVGATTIQLATGANTDLITVPNFSTLTGGNTSGGESKFGFRDLTLDGNGANQSGTSWTFRVYGFNYRMASVEIVNGLSGNAYSEWGTAGGGDMESHWYDFKIRTPQGSGAVNLQFNGPHDSVFVQGEIVAGVSGLLQTGLQCYGNGGSNFYGVHVWGYHQYGWIQDVESMAVGCRSEGALAVNLLIRNGQVRWSGKVYGTNDTHTGEIGVQIGDATHTGLAGVSLDVDLYQFGVTSYATSFVSTSGENRVHGRWYKGASTALYPAGSPPATRDEIEMICPDVPASSQHVIGHAVTIDAFDGQSFLVKVAGSATFEIPSTSLISVYHGLLIRGWAGLSGSTNTWQLDASNGAMQPGTAAGGLGARIFSGSGAPTFSATAGDIYIRSGTPTTPGQQIYVNTTGSTAWTPVVAGVTRSVNSISTPTTAGATALTDYVYLVSGTTTLTLPTAVGNTNLYTVKNTGSNTVTIATTSAQTIDGSSTATLPVANTSLDLISDGANWKVI
jgi:hypothetical protein